MLPVFLLCLPLLDEPMPEPEPKPGPTLGTYDQLIINWQICMHS